ncbi:MAG: hypothetical protein NT062_39230, partial [Proteobacteria bacterium]|nr:hypothetical protein [Pseudomonadota bacterium]
MRHVATLALILGSTSMAFADDGEDYGGPSSVEPVAPPAPYAAPIVDAAPTAPSVMATRWSIGLGVGSFTVAPEQSPDATTDFDITELSLRFRATYHLELELNLMGGRQVLADGTQGGQALGGGTLGLRYRFAAAQPWNWWVMAGVGETTIAD